MFDLKTIQHLLNRHGDALATPVRSFDIGGRQFDFNRQRSLMGVINLSEDSWYTESICRSEAEAIERGLMLAREGADLVDLGAESTLPDARRVGPEEQREVLVPIVSALHQQGVLVSVESYYPQVLEAAAQAGAAVFNLTGEAQEDDVLALAARYGTTVILCHVQGETPRDVGAYRFAEDTVAEMESHFRQRLDKAKGAGVERCIIDPGLGFYYANLTDGERRVAHQLEVLLHTARLNRLGYPTMNILPHAPEIFGAAQRRAAEPFFAVLAMLGGTHFLRTHELEVVARIRSALALFPSGE